MNRYDGREQEWTPALFFLKIGGGSRLGDLSLSRYVGRPTFWIVAFRVVRLSITKEEALSYIWGPFSFKDQSETVLAFFPYQRRILFWFDLLRKLFSKGVPSSFSEYFPLILRRD